MFIMGNNPDNPKQKTAEAFANLELLVIARH